MGTITTRKRADGSSAYTAQIRINEDGKLVYSTAQTFSKKAVAQAWLKRREAEIETERATGVAKKNRITVGDLLDEYVSQSKGITEWGKSKKSDIARLKRSGLADKDARLLTAADLIDYAASRRTVDGAGPATVLNDIVWLRQAFLFGSAAYDLPGPVVAVEAAKAVLMRTKTISKPVNRKRRLSKTEEQRLLDRLGNIGRRTKIPMLDIVQFALITARRLDEICRLKWVDVDFDKRTGWLDDVKHPTQKTGNRRQFRMLESALEIIKRQPRVEEEVFPYNSRSVGTAFQRTTKLLEIEDLHFHDLRHEATSRLFERGYSIHEVAQFTLHESWTTLKRYTQLNPADVPER